jgi:putative glycosyltransferase (TIGR04348 family)
VKIHLITPAPLGLNNGNQITAMRWAGFLRRLGHRIRVRHYYDGSACDALIALHARRSYESIRDFHASHPDAPLIVALTGTDLYRDIKRNRNAQRSLQLATRLIVLQQEALTELPKPLRPKTRVIYQSAPPVKARTRSRRDRTFAIAVIGHLRSEKDPLRAALAARNLPSDSRAHITHVGRALDPGLGRRAMAEMKRNPRYRWLGELPHPQTRKLLAASDVLVITSRMEGSSNVLSEALASRVPVIASNIPGLIGTLGPDYPGLFQYGDTDALARLLWRSETDRRFFRALQTSCRGLSPLASPARELAAWRRLLRELR